MNHKFTKKLGAALLAGIMMFGALPGSPAPLPAAAAVEATAEAEGFSAAFADSYAKAGQPMTVEVQNASSDVITYKWAVDGVQVSTESSYTPTEDDLMKWISVNVACGDDTATLEMFFSKLPVVYINTEGGQAITSKENYIDAEMIVQGNEVYNSDTTTLYNGVTEIRGRGNSTWSQPKKPYRLKLDKKTDLFGMGKSKHWVLLANYLDESLQRNTLAYNLSGAMGMEQMSTVFVDVILNGDFVGNYQLCENIRVDSTRVDIFDWESFAEDSAGVIADAAGMSKDETGDLEEYMLENMGWITSGSVTFNGSTYTIADYPDIKIPSINGGYLLELDEYYDEVSKFKTDSNQPIMFKNPEFVYTNTDMMNYVQGYVQAFEDAVQADSYTASYEDAIVHYSELFDFDALVDYWLINEIFFNEEINKKSTYMYKDIDGLMFMGPIWDMDWSSGGEGQTYHTEQWATRYYSTNAQANNWYKYLIQDPYFFMKAQERYWEIRNEQVADMLAELDSNYELLKESAKANGERWGYKYDYKQYVDELRSWFNDHLTWLDEQMQTQDALRDSLGYHPSSRLALTVTDAEGNALTADSTEHAPADGVAEKGQSLKLNVQGGNNTTGTAVLYVNGRRTSETAMTANTTITVDVPAESLTAQAGEKNILEIQIENADGTINASRYVTVLATVADIPVPDCEHTNTEIRDAKDATCTEPGFSGDTYCSDCDEKLSVGEPIPALGHTWSDGTCSVCGKLATYTFSLDGERGVKIVSVNGEAVAEGENITVEHGKELTVVLENTASEAREDIWFGMVIIGDSHCAPIEPEYPTIVGGNTLIFSEGTVTGDIEIHTAALLSVTIDMAGGTVSDEYDFYVTTENGIATLVDDQAHAGARIYLGRLFTWEGHTLVSLVDQDGNTYEAADDPKINIDADLHLTLVWEHVYDNACDTDCNECGAVREVGEHDWTAADCENPKTCSGCGATEGEALGHDYENGICGRCDATLDSFFEDVFAGDFFFDSVEWAVAEGITTGATETTYDPEGDLLRAQFVTMLWRNAGSPKAENAENPFTDVTEEDFFYDAVLWAVEKGITNGISKTEFGAYQVTNRAQAVTFLWRYMNQPASTESNDFTDVEAGEWYEAPINWAVEKGVTKGMGDGTFGVENPCNRAHAVTFMYRALAD